MREAERRLHLAGCIRDRRNQAQVVRSHPAMLRIRKRAIGCGYEDAGDCDALRVAPLFMYGCPRACKRHVKARACDRVRSCIRLQRCGALHGRGVGSKSRCRVRSTLNRHGFLHPELFDHFPMQFADLLTRPTDRGESMRAL